ncbi:MAG TPA: hypothetical protein VK815_01050 [Candidatus Acidoferrales bacterium]|jgi:hypothetical protein|nr:hypothetical protein [Candidatus Acidoferrales bacterium]
MITYELKKGTGSPSTNQEIVWAFDLGKGSGETVWFGNEFILAKFKKDKTGGVSPRRFCFRNALVTFVTNWCKRLALRFSSLRYLTLS